jgi:dTDP-4-dehydrorhamnose 3,5-epimerase
MIQGVRLQPLKVIRDERGQVMHMMRVDDGIFKQFGEIYFSVVNPGVVKAWKKHLKMSQHFAVPRGDIKLVIYDDRAGSATQGQTQEIEAGEKNYQLVCIPPLVWYGFRAESAQPALMANCSDIAHDPKETEGCEMNDPRIPYQWKS